VEQVVEFTAVGIDDAQPVAGEMIGIEGAHQYAEYDTQGHQERSKTVILIIHINY
jgi:hypothetical protein